MSELMQSRSRLVLRMARPGQGRQLRVVDIAVGDHIQRRQRIRQNVRLAVPQGVLAVVGSRAPRGGRLPRHSPQPLSDRRAGLRVRRHEVFLELALVAGLRGVRGLGGQVGRVAEGRLEGGSLASRAVLERGAADVVRDCLGDRRCFGAVHVHGETVGLERQEAGHLAVLDDGDEALAVERDGAAVGEVGR